MMSNYARTQELVTAANNASGASTEQFNKTLESLETKLAQLKNAWDTFTTTLLNNELIKGAITFLTNILDFLNKITSLGPSWAQSAEKILLIVAAIKMADKAQAAFRVGLTQTKTIMGGFGAVGRSAFGGIQKSLANIGRVFKKGFWVTDTKKAAAAMTSYSEAVRKSEVSASRYQSLQNRGLATQKTKTIYDSKMVQLENQKAAATRQYASAMGLSNEQAKKELATGALLNSQNAAQAVLEGTLTNEEKRQIIVKGTSLGLSEKEIEQNLKNAASLIVKKGADEASQKTERLGLLTKIKYIAMALFAGKSARQEALAKLGLVPANGAATASQTALNAAIYAFPIGWILLGIAALVGAIVGLIYIYNQFTPEKKLEKAKEATEAATKAAEGAKEAYDGLKDGLDGLSDKYEALNELTVGTQEWRDAMREVNQQVLELIDKYPELAQYYTMDETGVLRVKEGYQDEVDAIEQSYYKTSLATKSAEYAAKMAQNQAQLAVDYNSLNADIKNPDRWKNTWAGAGIGMAIGGMIPILGPLIGGIAGTLIGHFTESDQWEVINKAAAESFATGTYLGAEGSTEKEKLTNWLKGSGFSDVTEEMVNQLLENKQALKEYGEQVQVVNKQNESYAKAISLSAIDMLDQTKYTNKEFARITNAASAEMVKSAKEAVQQQYSNYSDSDWKGSIEFQNYIRKAYGTDAVISGKEIKVKDEKVANLDVIIDSFINSKAAEEVSNRLDKFTDAVDKARISLNGMTGNADKSSNAIEHLFDKAEGGALTKEDLETLEQADLKRLYESSFTDVYKTYDEFIEKYNAIIDNATEGFKKANNRLSILGINPEMMSNQQTYSERLGIANQLTVISNVSGQAAAEEFYSKVFKPLLEKAGEDADIITSSFSAISDINSIEDIDSFKEQLISLGVDLPSKDLDNFINELKIFAKAVPDTDIEKLSMRLTKVKNILNEIGTGFNYNTTISNDVYEMLNNSIKEDFEQVGDSWVYVGTNMEKLVNEVSNIESILETRLGSATDRYDFGKLIDQNRDDITNAYRNKTASKLITDENYKKMSEEDLQNYLISVQQVLRKDIDLLGNELFTSNVTEELLKTYTLEQLQGIVGDIFNAINNDELTVEHYKALTSAAFKQASAQHSYNMTNTMDDLYTGSFSNDEMYAQLQGYQRYILSAARAAGLSEYQLEEYTTKLDQLNDYRENKQMDEYYQTLRDVYDIQVDIENLTYYSEMKDNLQATIEKVKELKDEYDNTYDSILKLQIAKELSSGFGFEVEKDQLEYFMSSVEQLLDGEIGGLAKIIQISLKEAGFDDAFINSINEAIVANNGIISPELLKDEKAVNYFKKLESAGMATIIKLDGGMEKFQITTESLLKTVTNLADTISEKWENSFDWLYNLDQYVNKLDRGLQRVQDSFERTSELYGANQINVDAYFNDLLNTYNSQISAYITQASAAGNAISEIFDTYREAYGSDFVNLLSISKTGQIAINQGELDNKSGVWDEETGAAFEEFVSKIEEANDSLWEAEDQLKAIYKNVRDIRKQIKESYTSLLDEYESLLKEQRKEIIDNLSNINSTIKEANDDLVDSMQEFISDQREQRENTKQEQELADLASEIAYLQADTSGANATKILELQKNLADKQQSYQDKLIDQTLNNMKDANEEASEQRERQIELLTAQNDYWEKFQSRQEAEDQLRFALGQISGKGNTLKFSETEYGAALLEKLTLNKTEEEAAEIIKQYNTMAATATKWLDGTYQQELTNLEKNLSAVLETFTGYFGVEKGDQNYLNQINDKLGKGVNLITDLKPEHFTDLSTKLKELKDQIEKGEYAEIIGKAVKEALNKENNDNPTENQKQRESELQGKINNMTTIGEADSITQEISTAFSNGEITQSQSKQLTDSLNQKKASITNTSNSSSGSSTPSFNRVTRPVGGTIKPNYSGFQSINLDVEENRSPIGPSEEEKNGQTNTTADKDKNNDDIINDVKANPGILLEALKKTNNLANFFNTTGTDEGNDIRRDAFKTAMNELGWKGEMKNDIAFRYINDLVGNVGIFGWDLAKLDGDLSQRLAMMAYKYKNQLLFSHYLNNYSTYSSLCEDLGIQNSKLNRTDFIRAYDGYIRDTSTSNQLNQSINLNGYKEDNDKFTLGNYAIYKEDLSPIGGWENTYSFKVEYPYMKKFKTGGLADFTGPAWLDGTKANPELVLNSRDTQNFIQLRDILRDFLGNASTITNNQSNASTSNTFDIEINVDSIDNDYDVDELAQRIKTIITDDAMYRNVNLLDNSF